MSTQFTDRQRPARARSDDPSVVELYRWIDTKLFALHDAWTPTWTAVTVNPALGNGTLTGQQRQFGDLVHVELQLVIGSTTTLGTGAYIFSLPFPAASDTEQSLHGHIHRPGGGGTERAISAVVTSASSIRPVLDGAGNRIGSTTALAIADVLVLSGWYRPA